MLLELTITAEGPLAFPERRFGEQFRASLGYVPGGAIYGALGFHTFDAARFRALRCHNAYPIAPGDPWSRPLPLSALQPKGTEDAPIYDFHAEDGLSQAHFAALAQLQHDGIGERRAEGFGHVRICDEFHLRECYPREEKA